MSVVICALVLVFFAVIATGPAFVDRRAQKQLERDRPMAKVVYLPSAACRGDGFTCPDPSSCAICKSSAVSN